jgi:putative transposase
VGGEGYVLACRRYIELNPVRAAMVAHPADFDWSSHAANTEGKDDPLLRPHPCYLALGATSDQRQSVYRAFFDDILPQQQIDGIRAYVQQQRALGSDRFQAAIERKLGRCASVRAAHRPPAKKAL